MTTGGIPSTVSITISEVEFSHTSNIDIVCATHLNGVRTSGIEEFYEKVISLLY